MSPAQSAAVHAAGHVLVSACPGSGKTTTLAHRAAHLLRTHPGRSIAAVTFTNEAASELRARILRYSPGAEKRIRAGTFHRLAKQQLIAAGRSIRLAGPALQGDLLRRACAAVETDDATLDYESAVNYVDAVKATTAPPRPAPSAMSLHEAYLGYQRLLRRQGLLDFADLILDSVAGMGNGTVQPLPVAFLLVDEFQDCDPAQLAWVLAHAAAGVGVTVVGDDDQAIYGWRNGQGYVGMQQFLASTHAEHVRLDASYRCGTDILSAAAQLIGYNTERVSKALRSVSTERGALLIHRAADRTEEARLVAEHIGIDRQRAPAASWAVLARTNALLDPVEIALSAACVPQRRVGSKSLWESPGPALLLDVLVSLDRKDMAGIDRLLAASGVGEAAISSLHGRARSAKEHALSRFLRLKGRGGADDKAIIADLRNHVREWVDLLATPSPPLGRLLYAVSDWMTCHIREPGKYRYILSCAEALNHRFSGSLRQRLALVARPALARAAAGNEVMLMTLHAAKGREFDRVWIIGCEEGVLPHQDAPLAEERRLFYVGMTRARQLLVASHSVHEVIGSPFLREAGFA